MRFTSEELAKTIGIKIGNRIKFFTGEIATVVEGYQLDFPHSLRTGLHYLIDGEFEILPPIKKVGEQFCEDLLCCKCPLWGISCGIKSRNTLYDKLNRWNENYKKKEVYDILKTRLDKEVKDE